MVKYSEAELDDLFTALGDPVRRAVVRSLANGEQTMGTLAKPFQMTMPAVMKHVAVLEKCRLVRTEKRGRVRYCRLEAETLNVAQDWLSETTAFWTQQLASLARHLQSLE